MCRDKSNMEEFRLLEDDVNDSTLESVYTIQQIDNSPLVQTDLICDDIEEILIAEVKKRREIWDYKLPITRRTRDIVASHWEQISKELNGILTPTAACKKWRYLKDSYMRIRNNVLKQKSGSAASKPIKWKWYEHLQFLHDMQNPRSTTSNIDNAYDKEKSGSSACSELEEVDFIPKRHKKDTKERSFGEKDTWEKLATIMKEPFKIETFASNNSQSQDAPVQDNKSYSSSYRKFITPNGGRRIYFWSKIVTVNNRKS